MPFPPIPVHRPTECLGSSWALNNHSSSGTRGERQKSDGTEPENSKCMGSLQNHLITGSMGEAFHEQGSPCPVWPAEMWTPAAADKTFTPVSPTLIQALSGLWWSGKGQYLLFGSIQDDCKSIDWWNRFSWSENLGQRGKAHLGNLQTFREDFGPPSALEYRFRGISSKSQSPCKHRWYQESSQDLSYRRRSAAYIWEAGGGWGMDHPGSPPDSQPSQLLFSWHPSLPSDSSIHKRRKALFGLWWSLHHC